MKLNWDAAPGAVRKYTVTYKPQDGDPKEVRQRVVSQREDVQMTRNPSNHA